MEKDFMLDAELNFFASRLTQLRENKGISARDMSLSIGQSVSYINKIENKRILPSISIFLYICEYLGISPRDYFDVGNNYPDDLNELIENLKELDGQTLNHLSELVKKLVEKK